MSTPQNPLNKGEVILYGQRYPVTGPVREELVSQFPGKIVIGDPSRVDDPIASSYVMSDWQGGLLIRIMDPATEFNRFYWSTCATWFRKQLTLGPLPRSIGSAALPTPIAATFSTASTGGTLAGNTTYYYRVTATNPQGETLPGPEASIAVPAGTNTNTVTVNWTTILGATGYKVYGRSTGAELLMQTITSGATSSWVDTGSVTPSGAMPTTNTTALSGKDVVAGCDYNNTMYVAFADHVIKVNADETLTDMTPGGTGQAAMPSAVTQMLEYRYVTGTSSGSTVLVVCYGSGYQYYDGSAWHAGAGGEGAQYMTVWDDYLVKVDQVGNIKYSTDLTAASPWTAIPVASGHGSVVPMPAGSVTGVFVWPAGSTFGQDALIFSTTQGLYFYDDTAQKIRRTQLILPKLQGAGLGSVVHQGVIYYPTALQVLRYQGGTVDPVGLDRDWGLPSDHRGTITTLADGVSLLLAAVDASQFPNPLGNPIYSGDANSFGPAVVTANSGYATIYLRTDQGWHTLYASSSLGNAAKWLGVSTANTAAGNAKYRLFFGANSTLNVLDVYPYIQNPVENNLQTYNLTGELQTPWTDMGWSEIDKLALSFKFVGEQINQASCVSTVGGTTCKVDVYYGTDFNTNWTYLTTVNSNRPPTVQISTPTGLIFKTIRFRYVLTRCDVTKHTPILRFGTLTFLKMIDARWGYRFTVDTSQLKYSNLTPEELATKLRALAGSNTLGQFQGWISGQYVTRNVKVITVAGGADAGPDMRGQYQVSCVAFS